MKKTVKLRVSKRENAICEVLNSLQLPTTVLYVLTQKKKVDQYTLEQALSSIEEAAKQVKNLW